MKKMKVFQAGLLSLVLVQACGKSANQASDTKGHYEEATAASVAKFTNNQIVPAEYEASQGVIISLPAIVDFQKEEMVAAFFEAGVQKVWISVPSNYTGSLASSEFATLRRLLGNNISKVSLVRQKVNGPVTVWARDWSPLAGKTDSGKINLIDFNYYPNRQADDSTSRSLLSILPLERVSVPVYNEGGNFMTNSKGNCLMTTRVTDANADKYFENDMILDAEEIKDYYIRFAGCRTVDILPRIPYEGTGHIDMWGKFLDDETVIVNEIRDEVFQTVSYSSQHRTKALNMKNYLDARAKDISALGFRVVRIPMPAPLFSTSGDLFRSYSNSLFLNGTAIIPRYQDPYFSRHSAANGQYPDAALLTRYENEALAIYKQLGFKTKWINSDDLMPRGGAIHCITMQVTE